LEQDQPRRVPRSGSRHKAQATEEGQQRNQRRSHVPQEPPVGACHSACCTGQGDCGSSARPNRSVEG
jgi:hypothetical protein